MDTFCVTDSYYVHKIKEQIEKGEKFTYGGIPVRQGDCHEKAHIKLSKHFEMRRVATKSISLPERKVQQRYTETTTSNIIGAI